MDTGTVQQFLRRMTNSSSSPPIIRYRQDDSVDCSFSVLLQLDSAWPARHLTVNRQNPNYAGEKSGENVHENQQISAQKIRRNLGQKCARLLQDHSGEPTKNLMMKCAEQLFAFNASHIAVRHHYALLMKK